MQFKEQKYRQMHLVEAKNSLNRYVDKCLNLHLLKDSELREYNQLENVH
jgi:hypothetical protein